METCFSSNANLGLQRLFPEVDHCSVSCQRGREAGWSRQRAWRCGCPSGVYVCASKCGCPFITLSVSHCCVIMSPQTQLLSRAHVYCPPVSGGQESGHGLAGPQLQVMSWPGLWSHLRLD